MDKRWKSRRERFGARPSGLPPTAQSEPLAATSSSAAAAVLSRLSRHFSSRSTRLLSSWSPPLFPPPLVCTCTPQVSAERPGASISLLLPPSAFVFCRALCPCSCSLSTPVPVCGVSLCRIQRPPRRHPPPPTIPGLGIIPWICERSGSSEVLPTLVSHSVSSLIQIAFARSVERAQSPEPTSPYGHDRDHPAAK